MRTRPLPLVLIVFVVTLIPTVASADGHRAGLFGGISFATGSVLTGGHFNYERTWVESDEKYLYLMGDYSFHNGDGFTRQIAMIGGNYAWRLGPLSGGGRGSVGGVWGDGSSNVVYALGGSVDIPFSPVKSRSASRRVEGRIIVEQIIRTGTPESFTRYSGGLVIKLPR